MSMLSQKRYLGMIGGALMLLGVFLPLVNVTSTTYGIQTTAAGGSIMATGGGIAILMLLCAVATLVVVFADKIPALASLNNQKLTLIPAIIYGIIGGLILSGAMSTTGTYLLGAAINNVTLGIGGWICLLGVVANVVYPLIYKGE